MKVYVGMDQARKVKNALFVANSEEKAEELIEQVEIEMPEITVEIEVLEMNSWE